MAEERHDTSPLDNTVNAAIQTAKTAKQAKQVADGIKNAKNAAKGAQAAYSTATAAGGSVAGSTIGTAIAGPLGTVVGFLVTNKTFQKVVAAIMAAILLFLFIIVNFIGILFSYLGFMDANSFANEAQSKELAAIRSRIEQVLEVEAYQTELLSIISQEHDMKLQEMHCLEHKVQEYAQKKLEKENKEISITAVERAAVAWKYRELIEQAAADVIFEEVSVTDQMIPQLEFAFNGETYVFDNRLYFRYLKKRKTVIRKLGIAWARELQHREIMRRIFEAEVNSKVQLLLKKQPERIEKIRTLRNALEKVHHTVIVVVRGKQGVFEYFHIDAEVLKNTNGKYPLSQISGQERKRLKEKYGADKIWDVEEIYQVGARNIWYYNVMAEQKQAA